MSPKVRNVAIFALAAAALLGLACATTVPLARPDASPDAAALAVPGTVDPAMAPSVTIDGATARGLVEHQHAFLLDVRTPAEFAEGHVEGATNIPLEELLVKLGSLPFSKEEPVVVYCRSGRRSAAATSTLRTAGFANVHDLGAMSNWK